MIRIVLERYITIVLNISINNLFNVETLYNQNNSNLDYNITNEALLKSLNEKNSRITRLESDVKEYKEKLQLFESQDNFIYEFIREIQEELLY